MLQSEDLYLLAERVADSLVEPQRGNEENKQPLPVPQGFEIPPTITTLVREDEHQRLDPPEVLGQASNIKDTITDTRDDERFDSLDIFNVQY